MGRRSQFTPAARERFLQAIAASAFGEVAARHAGWSPRSMYRYLAGTSPEQREFRVALEEAETNLELRLGAVVTQGALSNPRLALALLERRFRERWARRAPPAEAGDTPDEARCAPDEVVVLDPAFLEVVVPRLLEAGKGLRADPAEDGDPLARFEDRAPRRVGPGEGGTR